MQTLFATLHTLTYSSLSLSKSVPPKAHGIIIIILATFYFYFIFRFYFLLAVENNCYFTDRIQREP